MLKVQEIVNHDVSWVAVMHNDHGRGYMGKPLRHIHSMVFVNGRLEKDHLAMLGRVASEHALKQRQQLDLARERRQERSITPHVPFYQPHTGLAGGRATKRIRERAGVRTGHGRNAFVPTPPCSRGGIAHKVVKLNDSKYYCVTCEKVQEEKKVLKLEQGMSY